MLIRVPEMKTVAFRFEGRHQTHLICSSPRMEEMTRERAIPIVIEGEVGRLENGDVDENTADFVIAGINTTGQHFWRAILRSNARNEEN